MSTDAQHTVVAGILQRPSRLVDVNMLSAEHFTEVDPRRLFGLAREYAKVKKGKNALDLALARAVLERGTSKKALALLPVVEEYAGLAPITDAEFRDAVSNLMVARRRALTKERATQAVEASLEGDDEAAREAMRRGLIEADDAQDDRPEDLRSKAQFDEELAELKKPRVEGESFDPGFSFLTTKTTFRRGQFTIIGGYAKDGKTHVAKTFAYNASERSGARVLFTSLEMDKREMRVMFICHHASTIDPRGVPWMKILDRTASKPELQLYARAMLDFRIREQPVDAVVEGAEEFENKQGGSVFMWAPKRRPTMEEYGARVRVMAKDHGVNVAVGDYLELFRPTVKTKDYRHDLTEMCYEAKETARDAEVWSIMCHQISRAGREAAEKRAPRHYIARDYGETAGIERSVSQLIWVYTDEALKADRQARMGMALVRGGGALVEGEEIFADFRAAYMGELA